MENALLRHQQLAHAQLKMHAVIEDNLKDAIIMLKNCKLVFLQQ